MQSATHPSWARFDHAAVLEAFLAGRPLTLRDETRRAGTPVPHSPARLTVPEDADEWVIEEG